MENHNFEWENSLQMAMFNSYVKLPEGNHGHNFHDFHVSRGMVVAKCDPVETHAPKQPGELHPTHLHVHPRNRKILKTTVYGGFLSHVGSPVVTMVVLILK